MMKGAFFLVISLPTTMHNTLKSNVEKLAVSVKR